MSMLALKREAGRVKHIKETRDGNGDSVKLKHCDSLLEFGANSNGPIPKKWPSETPVDRVSLVLAVDKFGPHGWQVAYGSACRGKVRTHGEER